MSAICGKCGGELIGFGADASCPFCDLAALRADNERLEKLVTTEAALHFEVHHADLARIAQLEAALRDIGGDELAENVRNGLLLAARLRRVRAIAADALKGK